LKLIASGKRDTRQESGEVFKEEGEDSVDSSWGRCTCDEDHMCV